MPARNVFELADGCCALLDDIYSDFVDLYPRTTAAYSKWGPAYEKWPDEDQHVIGWAIHKRNWRPWFGAYLCWGPGDSVSWYFMGGTHPRWADEPYGQCPVTRLMTKGVLDKDKMVHFLVQSAKTAGVVKK